VEEIRNAYKILVGNPEGKRPLGRHTRRWEDNIKMGLTIIEWKIVERIHLVRDTDQWRDLVNTVINLQIP
jgi:hypothetical protein